MSLYVVEYYPQEISIYVFDDDIEIRRREFQNIEDAWKYAIKIARTTSAVDIEIFDIDRKGSIAFDDDVRKAAGL